jgi:N-acyl homoserine lactone hydrolase
MNSLAMPAAWPGPLPEATPPPDMAIYQLPTGTYETRAAFAFKGGSFRDKRSFAATAILVTHPEGDLLSMRASAPISRLTSTLSRGSHALPTG